MTETQWSVPTQTQLRAADEAVNTIVASLRAGRGVHSETAISAAARVAGTFLFRSFGFPDVKAEPGSVILSDAANVHGPLLIQTLGAGLNSLKVSLNAAELNKAIPESHKPQLSVTATQELLEAPLRSIASKHGLTDQQAAHACALAAARLIQMCAGVLDPHIGFSLAAFGFIEGSKTMPAPRRPSDSKKKPWYKVW